MKQTVNVHVLLTVTSRNCCFHFQLLQKMIDDRASSVMNVKETGEQLLSGLEGPELNRMDAELQSLDKRWTDLTGNASERMKTLEEISKLAKNFQDIHEPLAAWLEVTEKKFTSLEPKSSNAAGFEKLINNLKVSLSHLCSFFKPSFLLA